MLTTLSHELRGPLNAVRGWLSMIENGSLPLDKIPRAVAIIRQNADSVSRLVECLFDLSRNAAGSLELKLEGLDLNRLVELAVDSAYPAATQHGVTVTISRPRRALFVNGDRVRLEQVVRNLVENAIKFTPRGGAVHLRTRHRHPFAELVVGDTGMGISAQLLPTIFDPFRRGLHEAAQSDIGVGLGLALVRELVQLHHGEIRARSAGPGRGTTFIVKLPLAAHESAPQRRDAQSL
jgi:signal transduction histidine kinase